ncbi:hypothetical protein MMC28_006537 [Mycoblastus sanguinarius]|nr:hypothetical protein [Mycoblastus sanguinarius]
MFHIQVTGLEIENSHSLITKQGLGEDVKDVAKRVTKAANNTMIILKRLYPATFGRVIQHEEDGQNMKAWA